MKSIPAAPTLMAAGRKSKKSLLVTSAATLALMMGAVPLSAQAQVVDVTTCEDLPLENPGTGSTVNVNTNAECTVADGDVIELEDDSQDGVTINIASGTTLISTDSSDEDTVIFYDNSENLLTVNIDEGAVLRGENGVIFIEGDETTITNNGLIENVGNADEGAIYYDRDADGEVNTLINNGTITNSGGGPTIGIDSLLGTDPSSGTVGDEEGIARFTLNNTGIISNTDVDDSDSDAINFNGDPGTTGGEARGCLEQDGAFVLCQFEVDITNSGTISAARDNGSNAAIRIEQDAVVSGTITNVAGGTIIGARNAINVNGAHSSHNLTITNAGYN